MIDKDVTKNAAHQKLFSLQMQNKIYFKLNYYFFLNINIVS